MCLFQVIGRQAAGNAVERCCAGSRDCDEIDDAASFLVLNQAPTTPAPATTTLHLSSQEKARANTEKIVQNTIKQGILKQALMKIEFRKKQALQVEKKRLKHREHQMAGAIKFEKGIKQQISALKKTTKFEIDRIKKKEATLMADLNAKLASAKSTEAVVAKKE